MRTTSLELSALIREVEKAPRNNTALAVVADMLEEYGMYIEAAYLRADIEGRATHEMAHLCDLDFLTKTSSYRPGEEMVNPKDGSVLVWIPPGEYIIGDDGSPYDDERPQHTRRLHGFWIMKYPVTVKQYRTFCLETGKAMPELMPEFNVDDHPIVMVSWYDAKDYLIWAGLCLPTEIEWEAAARGPEGRTYPWGNDPPTEKLCNFNGNVGHTTPVTAYPKGKGPFGTFDQAGNVWEWCLNAFDAEAYSKWVNKWVKGQNPRSRGPVSPEPSSSKETAGVPEVTSGWQSPAATSTKSRNVHGGSLSYDDLRLANHYRYLPGYRTHYCGIRGTK